MNTDDLRKQKQEHISNSAVVAHRFVFALFLWRATQGRAFEKTAAYD